jgi:hypothetical protein
MISDGSEGDGSLLEMSSVNELPPKGGSVFGSCLTGHLTLTRGSQVDAGRAGLGAW